MLSLLFPDLSRYTVLVATGRAPPHLPRETNDNYASVKRQECRFPEADGEGAVATHVFTSQPLSIPLLMETSACNHEGSPV
ncbi:MAG: hypothetical protein IJR99_00180 [Kiritimatiellae bacterium]|nr:hypothetical protein [Kiritimatiellia bacterium]